VRSLKCDSLVSPSPRKGSTALDAKPVVLKVLLQHRHLQTHRAFCREYDRVAAKADPTLRGGWPSKAQFYRWLSGELVGLPYPDHCRVLESMFPGWTVNQLFQAHDGGIDFIPEPANVRTAAPTTHQATSVGQAPRPCLKCSIPTSRVSKRPSMDKPDPDGGSTCQLNPAGFPGLPISGKLLTRIKTVCARQRLAIVAIQSRRVSVHGTMYVNTLGAIRRSCTRGLWSYIRRRGGYRRPPCCLRLIGYPMRRLPLKISNSNGSRTHRNQSSWAMNRKLARCFRCAPGDKHFPATVVRFAISVRLPCSKTALVTGCLGQP